MTRRILSPLEALPALPIDLPDLLDAAPTSAGANKWKRSFDLSAACLALVVLLPLLIAAVAALWMMQGRPIFIRHKRVGKMGKPFACMKFRTMVTDAGEVLERHLQACPAARDEWNETFKLKADPRVTPLGFMMRKSSLDELPQLWNIMKGDMSFVGPRPIVADEIQKYGLNISDYYRVKPGLTGLWQVSGRSDTDYQTRVSLDVDYASRVTFTRDLKILLMTFPAVLQSRGSY